MNLTAAPFQIKCSHSFFSHYVIVKKMDVTWMLFSLSYFCDLNLKSNNQVLMTDARFLELFLWWIIGYIIPLNWMFDTFKFFCYTCTLKGFLSCYDAITSTNLLAGQQKLEHSEWSIALNQSKVINSVQIAVEFRGAATEIE